MSTNTVAVESYSFGDGGGGDWKDNGTYTAEAGDSASTLATDAGISPEQANSIVESQLGENYIGKDGGVKSNVEVGDVVAVPEQVENAAAVGELQSEINTNEGTIATNNKEADSLIGVADNHDNQVNLSKEINEAMPDFPDEPRGGIGIGTAIKNGIKEIQARNLREKAGKLNNTSDSLRKENSKKASEVRWRTGYLPLPKKSIKD